MAPPVVAVVGWSGSGKTTLVERLVAELTGPLALRVGTIKHSKHAHTLDKPGKDSFRHKAAGASRALFVGPTGVQLVADVDGTPAPDALAAAYMDGLDLVVVEGFMRTPVTKIEVVRADRSQAPATSPEDGLVAVATDLPPELLPGDVPVFHLDDAAGIARFVVDRFGLAR